MIYMIRYFTFLIVFSFTFSWCSAQTNLRRKINIDESWKFHFGSASDPLKDFNYSIANIFAKSGGSWGNTPIDSRFNDSSWRTVNLPHDWVVELPFADVNDFNVESHGFKPVGGLFPETSIG